MGSKMSDFISENGNGACQEPMEGMVGLTLVVAAIFWTVLTSDPMVMVSWKW